MPVVEGGIVVAPRGFGRFGGRLIAPDELSGRLIAVDASGRAVELARSGLRAGGDIGVESLGFVPAGFERGMTALLADRAVPGNPHPGTDSILGVSGAALRSAGVRVGDLLAATEGGAETIAVRCGRRACTVRLVAHGPAGSPRRGAHRVRALVVVEAGAGHGRRPQPVPDGRSGPDLLSRAGPAAGLARRGWRREFPR